MDELVDTKKVYIVVYFMPPYPRTIVAVCSTLEIALEYLNTHMDDYIIEEWELE